LAQPILQRIIDKRIDFRIGQTGVFLSKLLLKRRTVGRDVPFTGLTCSLTGPLIQGFAFFCPITVSSVDSLIRSGFGIDSPVWPGLGTSAEKENDQNQRDSHDVPLNAR
jgi:hypothetical protein